MIASWYIITLVLFLPQQESNLVRNVLTILFFFSNYHVVFDEIKEFWDVQGYNNSCCDDNNEILGKEYK